MNKDPRILEMIERFNYSPTTIGYAALTEKLEQFALSYYKAGMTEAAEIAKVEKDALIELCPERNMALGIFRAILSTRDKKDNL